MNTRPTIFKSRKFWLAASDAMFAIATMVITFILSDKVEIRVLVLGIVATLQPVVIALINGIASEDAAYMTSEATKVVAVTESK